MTTKIFVPKGDFAKVNTAIKESGVKHYPFSVKRDGYEITLKDDKSPLAVFLALKYNIIPT